MKMGFESNKRITKVYNNQRVTATVGGKKCYFRSKFEYCWALYIQFLKDSCQIVDWDYEPKVFYFPNEKTAPVQYRPDFKVIENDGTELWQETKGHHDGKTNRKFQRMRKHYPDIVMELVLQRVPRTGSKGANRRRVAEKYCRRIIDASAIFKQVKGLINFDVPKLKEI